MRLRTVRPLIALSLAALLPLAACSSETEPAADASRTTSPTATATAGETEAPAEVPGPGPIDNCGFKQTFNFPPKKIFTIKSTSTEMVVALGLKDKLVGTAFNDGPVLDVTTGQPVEVPIVSEQAPTKENVLEAEPNLVYAGWESNLTGDTGGDRETLAKLGVDTYVSPAACQEPAYQPKPMTFEKLWLQYAEIGKILGAEDAAATLVEQQQAELAKVTPAKTGTTALWWSSGDDTPFVGGGIGAPQMVMDAVGLENINAENPKTWDSMGWESIVDADPDVIILVDASWNTAEAKIKTLTTNAATQNMSAVKNKRFLIIPFPAAEAGVRSVGAATDLSHQLGELDLLGK